MTLSCALGNQWDAAEAHRAKEMALLQSEGDSAREKAERARARRDETARRAVNRLLRAELASALQAWISAVRHIRDRLVLPPPPLFLPPPPGCGCLPAADLQGRQGVGRRGVCGHGGRARGTGGPQGHPGAIATLTGGLGVRTRRTR